MQTYKSFKNNKNAVQMKTILKKFKVCIQTKNLKTLPILFCGWKYYRHIKESMRNKKKYIEIGILKEFRHSIRITKIK